MGGNWTAECRRMCMAPCGNTSGGQNWTPGSLRLRVLKKPRDTFAFKNVQTVVLRESGEGMKGMCDCMAQERQFCEAR